MMKTTMKKETKKQGKKTKRKGFEKKLLLTISKVNFEGKGGKIMKNSQNEKKNEKGSK